MKKTKIIRTAAGILCCLLLISSAVCGAMAVERIPEIRGVNAFAGGTVTVRNKTDGVVEVKIDEQNMFSDTAYNQTATSWCMPGGSIEGTITITNKSSGRAGVFFAAKSVGPERRRLLGINLPPADGVAKEYKDYYNAQGNDQNYTPAQLQAISNKLVSEKILLKVYQYCVEDDYGHEDDPDWEPQAGYKPVFLGMLNGKGILLSPDDTNSYYADTNADHTTGWNPAAWVSSYGEMTESDYVIDDSEDDFKGDVPVNELTNIISIRSNETAKLRFKLYVPTDLTSKFTDDEWNNEINPSPTPVNRGYNNTVAMIDWLFVVSTWLPAQPPSDPDPDPAQPPSDPDPDPDQPPSEPDKPTPNPGTGDAATPYTAASAACATSAAVIFYFALLYRPKKREEE